MVGDGGQTTPAPWLTYTQAGCNVGGVSAANIELENTSTAPAGDMTRVFGAGSPEWTEASTNSSLALTDFGVWWSLTRSGLSTEAAGRLITKILMAWLKPRSKTR